MRASTLGAPEQVLQCLRPGDHFLHNIQGGHETSAYWGSSVVPPCAGDADLREDRGHTSLRGGVGEAVSSPLLYDRGGYMSTTALDSVPKLWKYTLPTCWEPLPV